MLSSEAWRDSCQANVVGQSPLRLADGRWLWVAPDGIAVGAGGEVAVVGSEVTVWRKDLANDPPLSRADSILGKQSGYDVTNHRPEPISDSLIGAVFRRGGVAQAIPTPRPLLGRSLAAVHVAAGLRGQWDILLVARRGTPPNSIAERTEAFSAGISADLWYGEYDGSHWQSVEEVAVATHAGLSRDVAPALAVAGANVAFAYPVFDGAQNGIVLVHRESGRWQSDTMWIKVDVQSAQALAVSTAHEWLVVVAHVQTLPPAASALYVVPFDSGWGRERLVVPADTSREVNARAGTASTGVSSPIVLVTTAGAFASWSVPVSGRAVTRAIIRAAPIVGAGTLGVHTPTTVYDNADDILGFAAATLRDSAIVWMIPERGRPSGTRMMILRRNHISDLGVRPIDPRGGEELAGIGPDELVYVTTLHRIEASAPPLVSLRTYFNLKCKSSGH